MQSRSNLPVRSSSTNHGPQTVVHAEDTLKKDMYLRGTLPKNEWEYLKKKKTGKF